MTKEKTLTACKNCKRGYSIRDLKDFVCIDCWRDPNWNATAEIKDDMNYELLEEKYFD